MTTVTTTLGEIHVHLKAPELGEGRQVIWGGPAGAAFARLTTRAGAVDCRGSATWDGKRWTRSQVRAPRATDEQVKEIEVAVLDALETQAGRNSSPVRAQEKREARAKLAEIDAQRQAIAERLVVLDAQSEALEAEL